MGSIDINVAEFVCESPKIGDTYRNISTTQDYTFNYTTAGDTYQGYGLNTKIKLFIIPEQTQPEIEYTTTPVPFNAVNFSIGQLNYDTASFRLEFTVDDGDTCYYSIDIPYSSIIIT